MQRSRGRKLYWVAALLLLGALPTPARAVSILPTLDASGTYDYDDNPPGAGSLGVISFNTINVSQVQYQDLSTCNVVGPLCDAVVGVQPSSFVSVTLTDFTQLDDVGDPTLFGTGTITISDGSTTFLTGTVGSDNWNLSGAQLTLNPSFDLDNLSGLTTDNGGNSQFIDEFAAAVAAGAGSGDLPEIHIILNNFNGLNATTTGQIVNIKITSPIPEPNTAVLLGLGLIGMGVHAQRTRRKAAA